MQPCGCLRPLSLKVLFPECEGDRNITSVSMPKALVSMATAAFRKVGHGSLHSFVSVQNRGDAWNRN
jgi:hypothetical protein